MVIMHQFLNTLGVHLNEPLDFAIIEETLPKAGGKVLGAVMSNIQIFKNIGFKTYSKLYCSCVVSALGYCSGVWAFRHFDKIDMIQNRAIRYLMGVHRFTSISANYWRYGLGGFNE